VVGYVEPRFLIRKQLCWWSQELYYTWMYSLHTVEVFVKRCGVVYGFAYGGSAYVSSVDTCESISGTLFYLCVLTTQRMYLAQREPNAQRARSTTSTVGHGTLQSSPGRTAMTSAAYRIFCRFSPEQLPECALARAWRWCTAVLGSSSSTVARRRLCAVWMEACNLKCNCKAQRTVRPATSRLRVRTVGPGGGRSDGALASALLRFPIV